MPYLGNTGTILYPSQLQTSSLTTDTGDGLISISDIVNGTSTTDSGIRLSSGGVESALFTEVDGTILSYGINIAQIGSTAGTPTYDTARSGGIFRLDTRTDAEGGNTLFDKHCFVVKAREEGQTTEYNALGIDLNTGSTVLSPEKGNVGIGTASPQTLLDIRGEGADTAQVSIRQWNDGADGPDVRFHTSRGTVATPLGVQSGNHIGRFNSYVYDGTNEVHSGSFGWTSAGTDGESTFSISTRIASDGGGTSFADRLTIDSSGNFQLTGDVKAKNFGLGGTANLDSAITFSVGIDAGDCSIKLWEEDNNNYGGQIHYIADKSNGGTSTGEHRWYVFDDSSGSDVWSQLAVLDKSGNFGINTTTPSTKLEVYGGTAKLVRQHIGGTDSTGGGSGTYWKVGTWHGCNQSSRAKIVINGTESYANNENAFGETIINLVFENSNDVEGSFYTIGGQKGPIDVAVKVDTTPNPDICEIWVKYNGGYASNAINVDVTDGYFIGESTNTNSATLPTGATSLQSFFAVRTVRSGGNANDEQIRVDNTGLTVQRHVRTNLDYPTVSPNLRLIFTKSNVLDSRINFIRDTGATYIDANGLVKYANSGEPRFEYDQTTKEIKGLLFEREKTNLITDSDGGNYGYGMSGAINEPSQYDTAPDGSYVKCKYDLSSITGGPFLDCDIDTTLTSGNTYTLSAWLRGAQVVANDVSFAFVGETTNEIYAHTLNSSHAQGAVTDEWKRFELTFTLTNTQNSSRFQVFFSTQGAGEIISIWGAQLEESKFASSYIPRTKSAQSTRDSDRMYIGGQNFTNFYNQDEGTIVISSTPKIVDSSINSRVLLIYEKKLNSITTSGGKGGFNIDYSGTDLRHEIFGSSPVTGQASHTLSGTTAGTKYKAALAYKTNDVIYTVNGSEVGTDSTVVLPTDMGEMSVGGRVDVSYNISNMSDMTVDSIIYYPKKLSNNELINITSY